MAGEIGRKLSTGKMKVLKLRQHIARGGKVYLKVDLSRSAKNLRVHRLILKTFVGEPPPGTGKACHLNDDGEDNRLENLKWADHAENTRHKQYPPCLCTREFLDHDENGQPVTPGPACPGYRNAKQPAGA